MKKFILSIIICLPVLAFSQGVGIGTQTPNASAMLDVSSTNKGLLIPRMTEEQKNIMANPATGLLIWQTDNTPGFYYNGGTPEGPKWYMLSVAADTDWKLAGNNNVDSAKHFLGSTNKAPVFFKVRNTWAGQLDSGKATFFGYKAGISAPDIANTAFGTEALSSPSEAGNNTAIGYMAIQKNRSGESLTAVGAEALANNTTGKQNTALGNRSLYNNVSGQLNSAVGYQSMFSNTTGYDNTAVGRSSLSYNISGFLNTAIGIYSMLDNIDGSSNTTVGAYSLWRNLNGRSNTAIGYSTLQHNTSGDYNVALGFYAGINNISGNYNTFVGYKASPNSSSRINASAFGYAAYAECSNCLVLGSVSGKNDANVTTKTGIGTTNPGFLLQVGESGDGSVARANSWTIFSDERFKTNITPITHALDKLKQVSGYYYDWKTGEDKTRQAGLLAQEIERVLPEIISTDSEGYKSVDYGKMNALLLQAIKEQQVLIDLLLEKGNIKK